MHSDFDLTQSGTDLRQIPDAYTEYIKIGAIAKH